MVKDVIVSFSLGWVDQTHFFKEVGFNLGSGEFAFGGESYVNVFSKSKAEKERAERRERVKRERLKRERGKRRKERRRKERRVSNLKELRRRGAPTRAARQARAASECPL